MATHWQRVLSGAFGGALITGGLWLYTELTTNSKWLSVIVVLIGVYAIFYGRNLK